MPPVILIEESAVAVMALDVTKNGMPETEVLAGALVTGVNVSEGVTGLPVVTTNLPETPPIVNVTMVVTPGLEDDVWRILTLLLTATVPAAELQEPQLAPPSVDTVYSPPALMEMAEGALVPATVIVLDSISELRATAV